MPGAYLLRYAERHENIVSAIQREKSIKHWPRTWKVRLIGHDNPKWDDLAETLEAEADALRTLGCSLVQGYHYSKPLSEEAALQYVNRSQAYSQQAGAA